MKYCATCLIRIRLTNNRWSRTGFWFHLFPDSEWQFLETPTCPTVSTNWGWTTLWSLRWAYSRPRGGPKHLPALIALFIATANSPTPRTPWGPVKSCQYEGGHFTLSLVIFPGLRCPFSYIFFFSLMNKLVIFSSDIDSGREKKYKQRP